MATNDYVFLTRWRVPGKVERAYDILIDIDGYTRWWPQVYLRVDRLGPGPDSAGPRADLRTRGKLPYKLRWQAEVVEAHPPSGFTIRAQGDFDGRGIWSLMQDGEFVAITFDWRLRAEKPLLRDLSFLFKPLFRWNHRWAMARGEEGLARELARG